MNYGVDYKNAKMKKNDETEFATLVEIASSDNSKIARANSPPLCKMLSIPRTGKDVGRSYTGGLNP